MRSINVINCFLIGFFSFCRFSASGRGYAYFITDDNHVFQEAANGSRFIIPEKIEEAKKNIECLPAEKDTNGNWGKVDFGCQASIRFATNTFATNDAIHVKIIVRNTSQTQNRVWFQPTILDDLRIEDSKGNILERSDLPKDERSRSLIFMGSQSKPIPNNAGMQRKFELDLRPHFDFVSGENYSVRVKASVMNVTNQSMGRIESGTAMINIK